MPITLTFDIEVRPEPLKDSDKNDRMRISASFHRFGWENIGGSTWRYPALGTENVSEDLFDHVIPALIYFRSVVEHANLRVYNFTIDAHSEAGHRGKAIPPLGQPIQDAASIPLYPSLNKTDDTILSEKRLRKFLKELPRLV